MKASTTPVLYEDSYVHVTADGIRLGSGRRHSFEHLRCVQVLNWPPEFVRYYFHNYDALRILMGKDEPRVWREKVFRLEFHNRWRWRIRFKTRDSAALMEALGRAGVEVYPGY